MNKLGTKLALGAALLPCALTTQAFWPGATPAQAQTSDRINVLLNGRLLAFGNVPPMQVSGRVLVPLRGVFEALGATVDFDAATNSIFAVRDDTHIQLKIGSTQANINGEDKTLDVPAQTRFNRTLVPLRFVSEALGAEVLWSETQRTVYLKTDATGTPTDTTPPETPTPEPTDTNYPDTTSATLDGKIVRTYPQQNSFIMRTSAGAMTVKLSAALPATLNAGDSVQVSGVMQGKVLMADRVTVLRDAPSKFNATVISIISNNRLVVQNQVTKVRYTVATTSALPSTINVGDAVRVAGRWNGTAFEAATVTLLQNAPAPTGQAIDFAGEVTNINVAGGTLQVRGDNGQLYTVFYTRPAAFPVGTRVRIIGSYANGTTTARTVTRE